MLATHTRKRTHECTHSQKMPSAPVWVSFLLSVSLHWVPWRWSGESAFTKARHDWGEAGASCEGFKLTLKGGVCVCVCVPVCVCVCVRRASRGWIVTLSVGVTECTFWPRVLALTSKGDASDSGTRSGTEDGTQTNSEKEKKIPERIVSLCTRGPKTGRANTCQHISSPLPGVTDICGCSTMWLCGAKVFRHNFITFQQLCVTVPSDGVTPGLDRGRNHSYGTSLIFPGVTQAASFFCFVLFCFFLGHSLGRRRLPADLFCLFVCLRTDRHS